MTVHQSAVEALGDHDYLVRFQRDQDTVVVRVYAEPASTRSPSATAAVSWTFTAS